MLQRFARRFFPDPARAEDMAQTALMKAFARMGDLRSPEAFQTWLLRIARNECLNELTRQRVAQIPISTLEDQGTALEAPAGGADDPEEMLVRTQMQDLVRRVTATLPDHYRQTLTMRALEDRSYEEISEALDIPVTVARLWYCRARKRFRTAFIQTLVARRDVPDECQEMGPAIAELIEGTLARAKRDVVQGHLADCAACRQTEDELRNTAFRAPARAMLFALALARVPASLRRSLSTATSRTQELAGELALGAAGTLVLATGGFGAVPPAAAAQAAVPPQLSASVPMPFAVAAAPAEPATPRGATLRGGAGDTDGASPAALGVQAPGQPSLDVPIDSMLSTPPPSHTPLDPLVARVGKAGGALAVAVATGGNRAIRAAALPVALPLISD
jgi:RNA polymerase sigma-70 factor (ECF subfamily)